MYDKNEIMRILFRDCDLLYYGQTISHELILSNLACFLNDTAETDSHNVGIILHTGSVLFDVIAVAYAALSNILLNERSGEDIVSTLSENEIVVYKDQRYSFEGVKEEDDIFSKGKARYALLKQYKTGAKKPETTKLHEKYWSLILPYRGDSVLTDGRGIKKTTTIRDEFFLNVLGCKKEEIPMYIDTSTVIVISRERANSIINSIYFRFGGKMARLLDLVTVSYFTENEELRFPGNPGKVEPVLKICGNVSVARQKAVEKSDNRNIGLIVLGSDLVARGLTEIPALMKRKALKYVFIALHIDSENGPFLLEQYDQSKLFACTKDFLLANWQEGPGRGNLVDEMNWQIDAIIDREIQPVVLHQEEFGWNEYKQFRRNILAIRRAELDSDLKDEFIPNACSVMNVLITSVFDIGVLEQMAREETVNTVSPLKKINEMKDMLVRFPEYLKGAAGSIVEILESAYVYFSADTPKEKYLREYLTEHSGELTALIVPKAYYAEIIKATGLAYLMKRPGSLIVTTANRFDNNSVYDSIICLGDLSGRKFDPFRCRSSKNIITLLYSFESNLFKLKLKKANAVEKMYNSMTAESFEYDTGDYDDVYYDDGISENEVEEVAWEESEIDDYIRKLNEQSVSRWFGESSGSGQMSVVSAVGIFETGHKIFFSQMYKAYVLDEDNGDVTEKGVDDLREGDTLIFTQKNENTKDIIDDILQQLISDKKLAPDVVECYYMSKRWKEALREYKAAHGLRTKQIAEAMIGSGVSVQEMTIRGWLDEDSHTVGPRNEESILQIATLTEDRDMFDRYREYFAACAKIRKIRMIILKMLGQAIISKVSGKKIEDEKLFAAVADRISSLSLVLKLETITIPEKGKQVPSNVTNRPFMLKE